MTAPVILYTNAADGPTTGGVGGNGGYLSIFGRNLYAAESDLGATTRVYIGGSEVAAYWVGAVVTHPILNIQRIDVQVGHGAGGAVGASLAVSVVTSGGTSAQSVTFKPSGGRVLFVSKAGTDSLTVPNDFAHPARHLQTASWHTGGSGSETQDWMIGSAPVGGGAFVTLGPGDQVVIIDNGTTWSDVGFDNAWIRFRYGENSGTVDKHIHITSYPGGDVHYVTPTGTPPNLATSRYRGGIHGPSGADTTAGNYVYISNLRIDSQPDSLDDAAPVNAQQASQSWWVTNVAGTWPSTTGGGGAGGAFHAKGGLFSGHPAGTKVRGCHGFDFFCVNASENHGIYFDSPDPVSPASNIECAYNWLENITGGNGIQFYDNNGSASQAGATWPGFTGCSTHDNIINVTGKYGINLADNTLGIDVYNNVVVASLYAALRIVFYGGNLLAINAYNNTFYNCDQLASGSGNGQVLVSHNGSTTGYMKVRCNVMQAGPDTYSGSAVYASDAGSIPWVSFLGNQFYGPAQGWNTGSLSDTHKVVADAKFTSPGTLDFSLQATSPAIDHATDTIPALPYDIAGVVRPQGAANDIGAFERVGASGVPVPVLIDSPTISLNGRVAAQSTVTSGSWSNVPTSFSYQWATSTTANGSLTNKAGGTSANSPVWLTSDRGRFAACTVIATNASGSSAPVTVRSTQALIGALSLWVSVRGSDFVWPDGTTKLLVGTNARWGNMKASDGPYLRDVLGCNVLRVEFPFKQDGVAGDAYDPASPQTAYVSQAYLDQLRQYFDWFSPYVKFHIAMHSKCIRSGINDAGTGPNPYCGDTVAFPNGCNAWSDPATESLWYGAAAYIAGLYRDEPEMMMFEGLNEPDPQGSYTDVDIRTKMRNCALAIQAANPSCITASGGRNYLTYKLTSSIISDLPRMAYTYDLFDFANLVDVPSREASIDTRVGQAVTARDTGNVPVFSDQFGSHIGADTTREVLAYIMTAHETARLGGEHWELRSAGSGAPDGGTTFGIIYPDDITGNDVIRTVDQNLLAAFSANLSGDAGGNAPVLITSPTLKGTARVGTASLAHAGTYNGPVALSYQWYTAPTVAGNLTLIPGANLNSRFWSPSEVGLFPTFTETATYSNGSIVTTVRGGSAITFTTGAMTSPVLRLERAMREATVLSASLRKAGRMTCNGPNIINTDGSKFVPRGFVYGHGEVANQDDPSEDVALGANIVRFGVRLWGLYSGTTTNGQQIGAPGNLIPAYLAYVVRNIVAIKAAGLKVQLFFDSNCGQSGAQSVDMATFCTVNGVPAQNFWTAQGQTQFGYFLQTVRYVMRVLYGLVDFVEPLSEPNAPDSNQRFATLVIDTIRTAILTEDPEALIVVGGYPGYTNKNIAAAYDKPSWKPDHNTILTCDELNNAVTNVSGFPTDVATILAARNSLHVPVMVNQLGSQISNDGNSSLLNSAMTQLDTATGGSIGYTVWEKVSAGPNAYGPYQDGGTGRSLATNGAARLAICSTHFKAAKTYP